MLIAPLVAVLPAFTTGNAAGSLLAKLRVTKVRAMVKLCLGAPAVSWVLILML